MTTLDEGVTAGRLPLGVIAISVLLAATIFAFDLTLPLGVAGGVPYVALVLVGLWSPSRRYLFLLAATGILLTILGYVLSPPGGEPWVVVANRALALFVICAATVLAFQSKRSERQLRETHDSLETQVKERTVELTEANALLRAVVDNSPFVIILKDDNLRYRLMNKQFGIWHGVSEEEVIGRTTHEVYPKELADKFVAQDFEVMNSSLPIEQDYEFLSADGSPRTATTVKFPIFDNEGKTIGVGSIGTDITERKRAEEALRESEARFCDFADNLPMLIAYIDDERRYSFVNKTFEDWTLRSNDEVNGKYIWEVLGEKAYEGFRFEIENVLSGEPAHFEIELTYPDGIPRNIESTYAPNFGDDGQVKGYFVLAIDITERKKAESDAMRLGQALEESPIEIYFIDFESRCFLDVNRAARENLGYSIEELKKMTPADVGPRFDPARMKSLTEMLTSGEQKHVLYETVNRRKDGSDYLIELRLQLAQYRDRSAFLGIGEDITERKQAEIALREAKEHAEIASRSKSEFLANMSHELRTPLNAVIGFSEMIMGGILGPVGNAKYLEYAKDINASGLHLLALINDILDLSKIEAGKLELDEQIVDVIEALDASMAMVKESAEEAALSLKMHVSNRLPAIIADPIKVKQALINLLSNAVKFTGPGGTVSVSANVETDGDFVIRIADTGVGIAPEDIPKVMELFGQTDNSLTRQHQGTGLGLPLTKALIEMHEGTVVLESELGVGTTVTIRFPAERVRDCAT